MANICTNVLYCCTDSKANYQKIKTVLGRALDIKEYDYDDENQWFELLFLSEWEFPTTMFHSLVSELTDDKTLYFKILSYELLQSYISYRIYKNGRWVEKEMEQLSTTY